MVKWLIGYILRSGCRPEDGVRIRDEPGPGGPPGEKYFIPHRAITTLRKGQWDTLPDYRYCTYHLTHKEGQGIFKAIVRYHEADKPDIKR